MTFQFSQTSHQEKEFHSKSMILIVFKLLKHPSKILTSWTWRQVWGQDLKIAVASSIINGAHEMMISSCFLAHNGSYPVTLEWHVKLAVFLHHHCNFLCYHVSLDPPYFPSKIIEKLYFFSSPNPIPLLMESRMNTLGLTFLVLKKEEVKLFKVPTR